MTGDHDEPLVDLAAIQAAAVCLRGIAIRTPLVPFGPPAERCFLKAESLQPIGAFKLRGAYVAIASLRPEQLAQGVITYSSGNHAQGVALAARILGIPATIVMPVDAPAVKKQATASYGATIVDYDRYAENREEVAARVVAERGGIIVPPFNDLDVIAGQGTVGHEIAQQLSVLGLTPDLAVLPIGGGGLASGVAIALVDAFPKIRIVGVEPANADDARQSLAAGSIVTIAQPSTIADGVATQAVGTHTFPILQALVDDIVTVSESEIRNALFFVVERMKQVVEPTGALTTAALLEGRVNTHGGVCVSILCGGNLDVSLLAKQSCA